jgi:hypothetical protein
MKRTSLFLVTLSLLAGGCASDSPYTEEQHAMDRWAVQTHQQQMIENAILAQGTLYSHHFVAHSAVLNELGERDVAVIARHYRDHPGELNVRRDHLDDALYESRLQAVRDALAEHGVDPARVELSDGLPGGDGVAAGRLLVIREAGAQRLLEQPGDYRRATESTGATR